MVVDKIGVHITHCCIVHGCKYGDKDCPVILGNKDQQYLCESCDEHPFSYELEDIAWGKIKNEKRKLQLNKIL